MPKTVHHFLHAADLIFGIGRSFTETAFGVSMPKGKTIIQATLDPGDINQSIAVQQALVGDAKLTLTMLIEACEARLAGKACDAGAVTAEICAVEAEWMRHWLPKLTSDATPMTPYRVLWDLQHTVDIAKYYHHARRRQPAGSAIGRYGERVTRPEDVIRAIRRGIAQTEQGRPALLESITSQVTTSSRF